MARTTAVARPTTRSAAPAPDRTRRASVTRRLSRAVAVAVAGLLALLALPSAAQAYHDPITFRPASGPAAAPGSSPTQAAGSTGWGLTPFLTLVAVAVLVAGIVVVLQRVTRQRHTAPDTVRT